MGTGNAPRSCYRANGKFPGRGFRVHQKEGRLTMMAVNVTMKPMRSFS